MNETATEREPRPLDVLDVLRELNPELAKRLGGLVQELIEEQTNINGSVDKPVHLVTDEGGQEHVVEPEEGEYGIDHVSVVTESQYDSSTIETIDESHISIEVDRRGGRFVGDTTLPDQHKSTKRVPTSRSHHHHVRIVERTDTEKELDRERSIQMLHLRVDKLLSRMTGTFPEDMLIRWLIVGDMASDVCDEAHIDVIEAALFELSEINGITYLQGVAGRIEYASTQWLLKKDAEERQRILQEAQRQKGSQKDIGFILGKIKLAWQSMANCMGVDPELFFPERGASTREAKAVCRACVVRGDCTEYALANGEKFGIWGGLSERERRKVLRARALARKESESALGTKNTAEDATDELAAET